AAAEVAGLGEGGEEKARADDRRHALSAAGSRPDAGTGSNGLMATSESRSHQSGRTYPPLAHRATCVRGHGHRGQSVDKSSVATSHTEPNFTCPLEFGAKTSFHSKPPCVHCVRRPLLGSILRLPSRPKTMRPLRPELPS